MNKKNRSNSEKPPSTSAAEAASGKPPRVVSVSTKHHDVSVAILIGILCPGAGQCYNGQVAKGLTLLIPSLIGLGFLVMQVHRFSIALPLMAGEFSLWLFCIIEAAVVAGRLSQGETVRRWQWF